jgi:Flp pilus assembly protein TadD
MQQLSNAEESAMTLTDLPATGEPGNDTGHRIKPQDENVFTLAALNKSVAEGQIDVASVPHINVDAQTVFAVASAPQRRRKIYIAGVGAVLVAAAIVMQVFYFTYVASSTAGVALPAAAVVTRQINAVADNRDNETTVLTSVESSTTTGKVPAENSIEDTGTTGQTEDGNSGQREGRPSILAEETAPAEATALSTPVTTTALVFAPDTDVAEIMGHDQQGNTEEIRIIRGRTPDRIGALINAAYAAFVAGNYSDARQAYLGVLKDMPDNHDALLGMAAIAQRTGEPDEAGRIWMQVLADYPGDPVATAALINLMAEQDDTGNTRTLGKLLQDNPHAAFLYFSLGNLHAAASRWPEAQQAFAEASRLEGDNPDYAYNLAVSIEHAGDRKAALDHYKTALELAHARPVNFDSSVVMAHITALSEISHGR